LVAAARARSVLAAAEVDVAARGEGARRHRVRQRGGGVVGVNTDVVKWVAEPSAEPVARLVVERSAAAAGRGENGLDLRLNAAVGEDAFALACDLCERLVADQRCQLLRLRGRSLGHRLACLRPTPFLGLAPLLEASRRGLRLARSIRV